MASQTTAAAGVGGSSTFTATGLQKAEQHHAEDTRERKRTEHDWSRYYVNTHLRRRGYVLDESDKERDADTGKPIQQTPPTRIRRTATDMELGGADEAGAASPRHEDEDEDGGGAQGTRSPESDDNLDDEQGAEWEEYSCEEKNEWIEKHLADLCTDIKCHYVLPTAGRTGSNGDTSVYEGYAGVAYMLFHAYHRMLNSLPKEDISMQPTPTGSTTEQPASSSPTGSAQTTHAQSQPPSSMPHAVPPGPRRRASVEQAVHAQRQYCISLLQDALKYIEYCLCLLDDKKGASCDSNLAKQDEAQARRSNERISFIMGASGVYALAACIYHHRARYLYLHPLSAVISNAPSCTTQSDPIQCLTQRHECITKLLEVRENAKGLEVGNEALYGKAGYLYALNFVYSHLSAECERMEGKTHQQQQQEGGGEAKTESVRKKSRVAGDGDRKEGDSRDGSERELVGAREEKENPLPEIKEEDKALQLDKLREHMNVVKSTIDVVHNELIATGQKAKKREWPLYYTWHDTFYLGAAHGLVGILHQLCQSPPSVMNPTLSIIRAGAAPLFNQLFPSGNLRSSPDSHHDRLVQWCHGAPGLALLCCILYQHTHDQFYLQQAIASSDVVWRRGLLKKGVGLCHGIAGNAYVFLSLYHLTHNEVHLNRAYHFAHFSLSQTRRKQLFRQPDEPYSLFNGTAGLCCFMVDICNSKKVKKSAFPGYELFL